MADIDPTPENIKDIRDQAAAKKAYDKASPIGKSIPPLNEITPRVPDRPLSNEEAANFVREMMRGKQTKEQEYKEFTRQVPEKKYAKGGSIRGGGIEQRGKTKGRMV